MARSRRVVPWHPHHRPLVAIAHVGALIFRNDTSSGEQPSSIASVTSAQRSCPLEPRPGVTPSSTDGELVSPVIESRNSPGAVGGAYLRSRYPASGFHGEHLRPAASYSKCRLRKSRIDPSWVTLQGDSEQGLCRQPREDPNKWRLGGSRCLREGLHRRAVQVPREGLPDPGACR